MTEIDRIDTELLQRFSAQQAWEYRLVPYGESQGKLSCYGSEQGHYQTVVEEIEVLQGFEIEISKIPEDDFTKLLRQYYRYDSNKLVTPTNSAQVTDIVIGQGFLMNIIEEAFENYASDIHIETYQERCRIRFRIDGKLIERYVIAKTNYASLINQIKIIANLDISERRLPQDGRILFDRNDKKFDLRVSSLPTIHGEKIVLRLLTRHVELLELSNLGFTDKQIADYLKAISKPHGLVLICGPTGSGKSTTLYATLRRLNLESSNILTIEDPVEYTLAGVNQVQLKEEIGLTFGSALRTFLRQDPDIIMLGEIRDPDTAQMAIRSSLTGHLIFSTIHTNSAWGSIARLEDMEIHPYLIANSVILCIAQRLVRLLCPHCKVKSTNSDSLCEQFNTTRIKEHYTALGCSECYYTGYKGRRAIYEVIPIDHELSEAIRQSSTELEIKLSLRGITSLSEAGLELLIGGHTSPEELLSILNSTI